MYTIINGHRVELPSQDPVPEILTPSTELSEREIISVRRGRIYAQGHVLPVVDPNEVRVSTQIGVDMYKRDAGHSFMRIAPAIADCEILGRRTVLDVGEIITFQVSPNQFMKGVVTFAGSGADNTPVEVICAPSYGDDPVKKSLRMDHDICFQRLGMAVGPAILSAYQIQTAVAAAAAAAAAPAPTTAATTPIRRESSTDKKPRMQQ